METPLVELWDYAVEGKVQYRSFTHYKFPHDDIIGENDTVRFIGAQLYVHQDCLDTYGHLHDWMGFIVRISKKRYISVVELCYFSID